MGILIARVLNFTIKTNKKIWYYARSFNFEILLKISKKDIIKIYICKIWGLRGYFSGE